SFELPARVLAELIDRTRFAISTEETRYYLNGIFLHVTDENEPLLKAAATDGHRLARFTLARPEGAAGMPDVIVPRKAVGELRKLLEEALDGNVLIDLSASKIRFTMGGEGGVVLTSKLIDGTFPDYSRVIPTGNDKLLKVDPKLLFSGVDRVATIATEKTRAVKIGLDQDRVTLSVTSPDNGTAAEELAAEYRAEALEIGFNANYLKDILGQIDADTVELHLADAGAPTLIRENEASPALYVLMPMRV
ncbi:MAG: DNA polymerase III subunit beta, partial [Azonexus sp.]|nr:DNA polymerase III subunit beta [Erythrobacter sp.]MDZ4315399.1 DNA polymerase III subunit beta [Azonexus sp.]